MQGLGGTNLLYNDRLMNFAMEGQELNSAPGPGPDPLGGSEGSSLMCNSSEFMSLVQEPLVPVDGPSDLPIPRLLESDAIMVTGPAVCVPNHSVNSGVLDASLQRLKESSQSEVLVLHGGGLARTQQQLPPCTCSHLRWPDGEGEVTHPFDFEESLALQDVLPHPQITNPCPRCCNNIDSIFADQQPSSNLVGARVGVATASAGAAVLAGETIFDGSTGGYGSARSTCAVTMQWEESLQDLQSLLALQGHQPQVMGMDPRSLPMQIEPLSGPFDGSGSNFQASDSYKALEKDRTRTSGAVGGFSFGKIPAVDAIGAPEMTNYMQFSRASPTMPCASPPAAQRSPFQAPAGPVSAFPSNPQFRRGVHCQLGSSSPNSPSPTGMFPLPDPPPFPYPPSFININPSGLGLSSFMNQVNPPGLQLPKHPQPPFLMKPPSLSDLDQSRDPRVGECSSTRENPNSILSMGSIAGSARFPSPLPEPSGRRGGSEGSLLSGKPGAEPRGINHFATERQRREFLNEKYHTLRSLVPNPSKADRASIVADAIEYVKDLKRSVQELNVLVSEKRRGLSGSSKEGAAKQGSNANKRRRDTEGNGNGAAVEEAGPSGDLVVVSNEGFSIDPSTSHLRSSWQQRTAQSTGTQVDVRIVHDHVTIKLIKRKRPGSQVLLQTLVTLLELHLDLQNANGATIDDHDIYCFDTKVLDGASMFAGALITKLLEAVDRE